MIISGVGRLSKDPGMSYTPKGTALTKLNIAVNTGWGDNAKTVWLNLASFGQQAELLNEKFSKGARIEFSAEVTSLYTYKKDDGATGGNIDGKILTFNWVDKAEPKEPKEEDDGSFEWEE